MAGVVKISRHDRRHKHNAQPCPFSAFHFALFSINMKIYYVLLSESNKKKKQKLIYFIVNLQTISRFLTFSQEKTVNTFCYKSELCK